MQCLPCFLGHVACWFGRHSKQDRRNEFHHALERLNSINAAGVPDFLSANSLNLISGIVI